ncbi:hypothetical protein U1Q18_008140 [Sarracenia purpurea var. burkii]
MSDSTATEVTQGETSREAKGKAPLLAAPPSGGGYKRGVSIFDLILRVSAAVAALAATTIMGTTDQTLPFFTQFFQFHASYDDLPAFQYVIIYFPKFSVSLDQCFKTLAYFSFFLILTLWLV